MTAEERLEIIDFFLFSWPVGQAEIAVAHNIATSDDSSTERRERKPERARTGKRIRSATNLTWPGAVGDRTLRLVLFLLVSSRLCLVVL